AESRMGLLMNGLVKLPMQLMILFVGVLLFLFYQFHAPPVCFNPACDKMPQPAEWQQRLDERRAAVDDYLRQNDAPSRERLQQAERALENLRQQVKMTGVQANDADYLFIRFVLAQFPAGLLGLLIAVILCAAMSATAAALSSLGQTTVVDFYRPR